MLLDEENNIKNDIEAEEEVGVEPAVSDAGTYTIDDEEEDPKDDDPDQEVNDAENRDKDIHRTFGVVPPSEKVSSRAEWVSVWASNSFAEDNPIQEECDDIEERSSSSQRRRLPPTPLRQNGYQHKDNHDEVEEEDTNEYLRDAISLMTAMEARIISSSTEEATVATSNNKKEVNNMTPTKSRRPKTGGGSGSGSSELRKSSNNSAQAKAKEAKEKAAQQWQRRKNYDPLKSMSKTKMGSSANSSRDYTDESSDVESAASFSQRGDRVGTGGGPTNPRVALIRSDGGRHSLRQQHKDQEGHHGGPQSLGSPVRRPPFRTNVMSQNGGRSTSSLSSKEAEFQAWKRRKNYNPMRSATASTSSSKAIVSKTKSSGMSNQSAPEDNRGMSKIHK